MVRATKYPNVYMYPELPNQTFLENSMNKYKDEEMEIEKSHLVSVPRSNEIIFLRHTKGSRWKKACDD